MPWVVRLSGFAAADTAPARLLERVAVVSFVKRLSFGKCGDYIKPMNKAVDCQCQAFQLAADVLGRPWSALILTALSAGPRRFGELGDTAAGLGTKVLSARLKELEARGLVQRHVEPGPPVRVSYQLTARGRGFGHVAEAIQRWGRELTVTKPARVRRP